MILYYEEKLPEAFIIPMELILCKEIDSSYKMVYGYIRALSNSVGFISFSNDKIASDMERSDNSITRALRELKKYDWIHIERHVKKSKMYDRYYNRVIWIKKDYLAAKSLINKEKEIDF